MAEMKCTQQLNICSLHRYIRTIFEWYLWPICKLLGFLYHGQQILMVSRQVARTIMRVILLATWLDTQLNNDRLLGHWTARLVELPFLG